MGPGAGYEVVNAFPGLNFSFGMVSTAIPPGRTNEMFITDKVGRVQVITNLAAPTLTVFLDLSVDTFGVGDAGLVGLAFHPKYEENRQFYVFYTRTNRSEGMMYATLSRFETEPGNPWRAVRNSEVMNPRWK